ncbi:glycosyltransferase [bacterium]|nr:glycosyltransferase [bacterium]
MKIAHVPRRFVESHWGGTESVILETCRCLQRLDHKVQILTPSALSDVAAETIQGVSVRRFPYFYPWIGLDAEAKRRLDQKGGNLFSFQLMNALSKEPGLDIIHLHTAKRLGGIVRHVARKRRIPYIVSVHGGLLDVPAAEAQSWTEPTLGKTEWGKLLGWWVGSRRVFDDAAAILVLGAEEARLVEAQYPRTKVVQFPNGVDTGRFAAGDGRSFRLKHGIPESARVILVMGRLDPQKNQLLAVKALPAIRAQVPDAHLLLIGHVTNDAYAGSIRRTIDEDGLGDAVTLIPGVSAASPDLVNAFHAADLFLLPSIHEPFGIVILEAWAAGRAVVAARVGGIPSFCNDGEDALLFESGNASQLAEHVVSLLAHPDRARALSDKGRRKAVDSFDWNSVTGRLICLYEEAIRANPFR